LLGLCNDREWLSFLLGSKLYSGRTGTALYRDAAAAAAAAAAAPYSATHSLSTATGFLDSKENK